MSLRRIGQDDGSRRGPGAVIRLNQRLRTRLGRFYRLSVVLFAIALGFWLAALVWRLVQM